MNIQDIDQEIKTAMMFKHRGDIKQAIAIEEACFRRCKQEAGTPGYGMAVILKALGKLYIIDGHVDKAQLYFAAAAEKFGFLSHVEPSNQIYQREIGNCFFYLGMCSIPFRNSPYFYDAIRGMQFGGSSNNLPQELVTELAYRGAEIFNQMASGGSPYDRIIRS